jgi:hypothetical protein
VSVEGSRDPMIHRLASWLADVAAAASPLADQAGGGVTGPISHGPAAAIEATPNPEPDPVPKVPAPIVARVDASRSVP